MSTLGGVYNSDGIPADERVLATLCKALARGGPDGGNEFKNGSVALVYRAFSTNQQSQREAQPLVSEDGLAICWDGRLDNRDELISSARTELSGDQTDVSIVLGAYRKWGLNFLQPFLGDFALSLWDSRLQRLLLARDAFGPRPLFYMSSNSAVIWSSELSPLIQLVDCELEIDDEYVAGFLTTHPEPYLTPFKGIKAVPPGHAVIVEHGELRVHRFWAFDPTYKVHYKSDAEYEEHFRHLFRQAVRCRLRVNAPVWAQLSGGLDSSAIVCMADEIIKSGEAEAPTLRTVSYIYDESPTSDERVHIHCVEEKRARRGNHLRLEDYPPLVPLLENASFAYPDALDCLSARHLALCEAVRLDGARVLLTGHGGDEILCNSPNSSPELGDLLIRCQILRLHQRLVVWSQVLKKSYFDLFFRDTLRPLFPRAVLPSCSPHANLKLPPWFDGQFVARMSLHERNLGPADVFRFSLPSDRDQAIGFFSTVRMISRAAYRSRGLVEVSHPWTHRPLVEFMQAIPYEQRVRPGETRSLMRRSLRDLLPEKILKRKTKQGPDEAFSRAVAREWPNLQLLFRDSRACARGYIDASLFLTALNRARHGCERHSFALVQTISLEIWLRALEQNGFAVINTAASGSITLPAVADS